MDKYANYGYIFDNLFKMIIYCQRFVCANSFAFSIVGISGVLLGPGRQTSFEVEVV